LATADCCAAGIKDQELTIIVSMMLIELALLRLSILVCVIGLATMLAL
jgi:hypothetical protein